MGDAIELRDKPTIAICINTYNSNYILNADPYSTDKCKSHPLSKHSFLIFSLLQIELQKDRVTKMQRSKLTKIKLTISNEFICNTIPTSYTNGTSEEMG